MNHRMLTHQGTGPNGSVKIPWHYALRASSPLAIGRLQVFSLLPFYLYNWYTTRRGLEILPNISGSTGPTSTIRGLVDDGAYTTTKLFTIWTGL